MAHLVFPMMTPSGLSIGTILKTNRSLRALATWELPGRERFNIIKETQKHGEYRKHRKHRKYRKQRSDRKHRRYRKHEKHR